MSGTEGRVCLPECGKTDLLAYRAEEKMLNRGGEHKKEDLK